MKILLQITSLDEVQRVTLQGLSEYTIGRAKANLTLIDTKTSKRHAVLYVQDGALAIRDNGSTNGTMVNNRLVRDSLLKVGDSIKVGNTVLSLLHFEPEAEADNASQEEKTASNMVVLHTFQEQFRAMSMNRLRGFVDMVEEPIKKQSKRLLTLIGEKIKPKR